MAKTAVPGGAFSSVKDVEDRWVHDQHARGRADPRPQARAEGQSRRAWSLGFPRGCGRSPSRSTSRPASRVSSFPTTASTWFRSSPARNGQADAETVLQDVLVLASGQIFTRPDDRSIQARTVTLAVTPEQVDILVAASHTGR